MSEEMQPQAAEVQAGRPMCGSDIIAAAEQPRSPAVQQDKDHDGEESPAGGGIDTCGLGEARIPSSKLPVENENGGSPLVNESDAIEVELVAKLEALLTKDVEVSAKYVVLLRNHKETARQRRMLRADLRELHIKEGEILLQVKLHLARKGRAGGWAEFLRQRKPKSLSRTTADRWIKWYLDSTKQEKSSPASSGEASENAPQNESGAFSGDSAQSPSDSHDTEAHASQPSDQQPPDATDSPSGRGPEGFEDIQQVILVLRKRQVARFKAAAEFLVGKNGSETRHEAIYVTVIEAAARLRFLYPPTIAELGEMNNASKGVNPGTETPAEGSKAA